MSADVWFKQSGSLSPLICPTPDSRLTGQTKVESAMMFEIRLKVLPVDGASEIGY